MKEASRKAAEKMPGKEDIKKTVYEGKERAKETMGMEEKSKGQGGGPKY